MLNKRGSDGNRSEANSAIPKEQSRLYVSPIIGLFVVRIGEVVLTPLLRWRRGHGIKVRRTGFSLNES